MYKYNLMERLLAYSLILFHFLVGRDLGLDFDSNKIILNKAYIYEYSARSEKYIPDNFRYYYYTKSEEIVERFIIKNDNKGLSWITKYTFNWDYMMLKSLELYIPGYSENVYDDICLNCTIKSYGFIDFSKNVFSLSLTTKVEEGIKTYSKKYKFKNYPTYFYGNTTDFDLWYSLKFYPIEEDQIIVYENNFGHNVEVAILYLGKEEITVPYGSILCHKFKMVPNSFIFRLFAKDVYIWLTAEDDSMYMVKYENDNARDSLHPRIEFRLFDVKDMTLEEWEALKRSYEN